MKILINLTTKLFTLLIVSFLTVSSAYASQTYVWYVDEDAPAVIESNDANKCHLVSVNPEISITLTNGVEKMGSAFQYICRGATNNKKYIFKSKPVNTENGQKTCTFQVRQWESGWLSKKMHHEAIALENKEWCTVEERNSNTFALTNRLVPVSP